MGDVVSLMYGTCIAKRASTQVPLKACYLLSLWLSADIVSSTQDQAESLA